MRLVFIFYVGYNYFGGSIMAKVPIKNEELHLESSIRDFLNPKHAFFKIDSGAKLMVKDGTYVYKNDIIMITSDKKSIHSSISGHVLGIKDMNYIKKGKQPSLVIENDFKENMRIRKSAQKFITKCSKKEFIEAIEDAGMYGSSNLIHALSSYEYDNIIINGIDSEPHFGSKYFYLCENVEEILETIDLISDLFEYESATLAIKNVDSTLVTKFMDVIGTYPNIQLRTLADEYPIGIDAYLKRTIGTEKSLVIDVKKIVDIYNILKKGTPISEKKITISGNAVSPKSVLNVKIGTLLSEAFLSNFDFSSKNVDVYINGLMRGKLSPTLRYVIDEDIDGVLVMEHDDDNVETECLNCGLCHKSCPVGLNPKYVRDHEGRVKHIYKEGCLECGLCDYVCPANRHLQEYMRSINYEKKEKNDL